MTDYEDYAYDDDQPYSYDDQNMDYGYGDDAGDVYGYGDAEPDESAPIEDMGYEQDTVAEEIAPKRRTPKRRCSVTKYSLVSAAENGGAEAEMVKNLQAAEIMNQFRNGGGVPPAVPSEGSTDSKSVDTVGTLPRSEQAAAPVKVSKFSRLRKRLSIFG
ncbi:hypothetical protein FisN_23Hh115 [Fistulifera solaris]|jgi:hypothetical protein|uniref:Uncharacterized protein n=1 Tax=Fistulifera solaris TaxID=1519565 RepID=A0A1Z5KN37_FISSO|nr:hypothetical protein FisN_23Hh115 [Fistulifera solaris]|eukprot:GAX27421.1 hypothetical protein FisN_23Hh115 [Fistulifera solaris]